MNGYANGSMAMHGNERQGGEVMGMGQMLDRRYNVSERDMMPQKRRKIVDERKPDEQKAQFSGGGKGGVLGSYMRDQREQGKREASAGGINKSVDLTGGEQCTLSSLGSLFGDTLLRTVVELLARSMG